MKARASSLLLAPLAVAVSLAACHAARSAPPPLPSSGQVEHIVLVWLNDGTAADKEAAKAKLIATVRSFPAQIPGIVSVDVGDALLRDLLLGEGAATDEPFDLVFVMRFANKQALDAYLVHPVHTRALAEVLAPAVRRVAIHDAVLR